MNTIITQSKPKVSPWVKGNSEFIYNRYIINIDGSQVPLINLKGKTKRGITVWKWVIDKRGVQILWFSFKMVLTNMYGVSMFNKKIPAMKQADEFLLKNNLLLLNNKHLSFL